ENSLAFEAADPIEFSEPDISNLCQEGVLPGRPPRIPPNSECEPQDVEPTSGCATAQHDSGLRRALALYSRHPPRAADGRQFTGLDACGSCGSANRSRRTAGG